jgi:hypothetical protein
MEGVIMENLGTYTTYILVLYILMIAYIINIEVDLS